MFVSCGEDDVPDIVRYRKVVTDGTVDVKNEVRKMVEVGECTAGKTLEGEKSYCREEKGVLRFIDRPTNTPKDGITLGYRVLSEKVASLKVGRPNGGPS
jgi:hypothetical protein